MSTITTERLINDDLRNDFIDSFALLSSISGGYMIVWNSTKLCSGYTMFANKFIPEPQVVDQDTKETIQQSVSKVVEQNLQTTNTSVLITSTNISTQDLSVLSSKGNRQVTVDLLLERIEKDDNLTDDQKKNILVDSEIIYIPPRIEKTNKVKLVKIQEKTDTNIALEIDVRNLSESIYCLMKKTNDICNITFPSGRISIIKNKNDFTINILGDNDQILESKDENTDGSFTMDGIIVILGSISIGDQ